MSWSQLSAILYLRWRLTRNQFVRGGAANAVIAMIATVIGFAIAIGAGVAGLFVGAPALAQASPLVMMLAWDGAVALFLFMWFLGVLTEIQRSETIDLARLLHLPVSLRGIFVMNYVASHLTMSLIIFLPATMALCLGLIWEKGWAMVLLIPLVLSFVFMITAWTYCLRGWLVALLVNPRRRRTVLMIATLTFVLLAQTPNLYFNLYLRHVKHHQHSSEPAPAPAPDELIGQTRIPAGFMLAHTYLPPLWVGNGAMALVKGNPWPALLACAGASLLGAIGLGRAYRSTLRFYLGQEKARLPRPVTPSNSGGIPRKNFIERRVPFAAEDVSALALTFFRSLSRAPEIRMQFLMGVIIILVLGPVMFVASGLSLSEATKPFGAAGSVAFTFFGMSVIMSNLFGYDREGFRALVLSPTRRRDILLAKNICLAPIGLVQGVILLLVLGHFAHLSPLVVLAGLFKLVAMFFEMSVVGNWISIWVPYRVRSGGLNPPKPQFKTVLLILATQFLSPVLMIPIFIPPLLGMVASWLGWCPADLADALLSLLLLGLTWMLYRLSLPGLGDMLEDREKQILLKVTQEGE